MTKKLITDKYVFLTDRGIKNGEIKNILLLSDIHIGRNFNTKHGRMITSLLELYLEEQSNIDSIVIPGDHVNGAKAYLNKEYMNLFKYLLEMFGQKAPTILSRGNHDLLNENEEIIKIYKDLDKIPNIYPLDNEQVKIGGINYTGFTPRLDAYSILKYGEIPNNMFIEDYEKEKFSYNSKDLNVNLMHDPITLSSKESLYALNEDFKLINLITSGHLHNGYVPTNLEYMFTDKIKDMGYWECPYTGFVTDMCRGAYFLGDKAKSEVMLPNRFSEKVISGFGNNHDKALLVVTKGIHKFSFLPIGNPSVTEIIIKGCNYKDSEAEETRKYL